MAGISLEALLAHYDEAEREKEALPENLRTALREAIIQKATARQAASERFQQKAMELSGMPSGVPWRAKGIGR